MAMKIRRRKKGIFAESAASSDLAFILIIYFLVIAGFNINQGFLVNLPAKDTTRLVLKEELMRFEMDGFGKIYYEGASLDIRGVEREIGAAVAVYPNLAVVLSIDPKAPWQQVVYFVELAQKLQVGTFSFNMKEQPL